MTDETGSRTCYEYDPMGRVKKITYPSETQASVCDTSAWAATTIDFSGGHAAAYGMPAGHWRQTVRTGNGRKILVMDALWRPVVEQTLDLGNVAETVSEVIRRYDAQGRQVFRSYPVRTGGAAVYTDPALKGTHTAYDALDRVTQVRQDWEGTGQLTTTTEYLPGFQTRVTNPRGVQTATQFQAFDRPDTGAPAGITTYAGAATAATEIQRDVFGKITALRRRNASGSVSLTRSYAYNAHQELCRSVEPETGAALTGYDGAGNPAWSAAGLPAGTACSATGTEPAISARKVSRTYDARNRLTALTFADGKGNQTWTYAPDGLPATITTRTAGDSRVVTNNYAYNRRRLLTREEQALTGWGTYYVNYAYNGNGHLATVSYPAGFNGAVVDYAPNALGQPTRAGTFATGVKYHPNGAIREFTYGNGIRHTLTQNARGLPDTRCDFHGTCNAGAVLNDGYDYDQNGNVAAISDGRTGNRGHRTMTYDGLDRLTQAVSPMFGTATYAYDALDNLTRVQVTGGNRARNHYYCYDAGWRLNFVRSGPACTGTASPALTTLEYDVRGNLSRKNGQDYTFDLGNRLRSVAGKEDGFHYDGHGRRVLSTRYAGGTGALRSAYSLDGKLVFQQDQGLGVRKDFIYLGNSLIAERSRPGTAEGTPVTVRYQHTDALGSPVAVTNESRVEVERTEYEPYGWPANRGWRNGVGYTGHAEDAASKLVYMQQRYYDPVIGRFLSVDPVTAYSDPVGQFNRYRYANNNPYRFTDPDGRYSCEASICAAVKSYVEKLRESRSNLRDRSEQRKVDQVLRYIGTEGSKGPHYKPGELKGDTAANTDQNGTTTIDVKKMDSSATGAMVIGHEARHDLDAIDRGGPAGTSAEVRATETRAYDTEATIGKGLGINISKQEQARGVDGSVKNWEDRQKPPEPKK